MKYIGFDLRQRWGEAVSACHPALFYYLGCRGFGKAQPGGCPG